MSATDDLGRYADAAQRARFAAQSDLVFDFISASAVLPRLLPSQHGMLALALGAAVKECLVALNEDSGRTLTAQLCAALEALSAALLRLTYTETYFTDPER